MYAPNSTNAVPVKDASITSSSLLVMQSIFGSVTTQKIINAANAPVIELI
jgi:hypothetical protein